MPGKGKRFPSGKSGNPKGRPKLDPDIKQIRELTLDQVKEMGVLILTEARSKLKVVLKDPETPVLKAWLAAVADQGIKSSNFGPLEALLNRLLGKPPESQDPPPAISPEVSLMTPEERILRNAELIRRMRAGQ